MQNLEIVV